VKKRQAEKVSWLKDFQKQLSGYVIVTILIYVFLFSPGPSDNILWMLLPQVFCMRPEFVKFLVVIFN
jgi:hypothetical protein